MLGRCSSSAQTLDCVGTDLGLCLNAGTTTTFILGPEGGSGMPQQIHSLLRNHHICLNTNPEISEIMYRRKKKCDVALEASLALSRQLKLVKFYNQKKQRFKTIVLPKQSFVDSVWNGTIHRLPLPRVPDTFQTLCACRSFAGICSKSAQSWHRSLLPSVKSHTGAVTTVPIRWQHASQS